MFNYYCKIKKIEFLIFNKCFNKMVECEGINNKTNKKCKSPAKYIVNIDNKINYRCGRHCRNINDKKFIENIDDINENKKSNRKNKTLDDNIFKSNIEEEKENNIIQKIISGDENEKIETLFTKIDKLCDLLNNMLD